MKLLPSAFLYASLFCALFAPPLSAADTASIALPDDGWRLWPDQQAAWKDDELYLPDDVDLTKLPVNAPTGGWDVLNDTAGVPVTLPGTVEQYFWGKFGFRHYTSDEYTYAGSDPEPQNGNYEGVSWWWREIDVPASFRGKVVLLHVRGARQRAEIYVNHQLAGYDMIAETSFDCDVTKAIRPGEKNQIAVRITNPGGRMDWKDFESIHWGQHTFQRSHGFGGVDRGLTLTAHDPVYLADTWALDTPEVRTITAHATIQNTTDQEQQGSVRFEVVDSATGSVAATAPGGPVSIPAHTYRDVEASIACPSAQLWDLDHPKLYTLHTQLTVPGATPMADDATKTFGFRWFEPRGIGQQAGLYLDGRRIRLYTAISWGFWGLNGLWPTPELAKKEVEDAKQLGMNMLNFHRDIGKEEVLAQQDQLGLLRYMEPGGGLFSLGKRPPTNKYKFTLPLDTSGQGGAPDDFSSRYEVARIERMVRQFRSHPSLVIYVIQNEIEPDLTQQQVYYILRDMHTLDPSRVIVTKSGISPNYQAWFAPYAKDPMTDEGTGYSGWRDQHTVGGPGVWQDSMYQKPDGFTHRINDRREIVDWGEMLGAAVGDNHPLMVRQIQAHGGTSYDLKDHEEIADAYHQFLDKWGFRTAFPTDDAFFRDLGNKEYEFWSRVIETARLCESNDILTISGWESTAIENHSGLVDNLRNFHGDPAVLAPNLAPLLPVIEAHSSTLAAGAAAELDLYLVNETPDAAKGTLHLTLADPSGQTTELGQYPAPGKVPDQFAYPVKMNVATPALTRPGKYKITFTLDGDKPAQNSLALLVVQATPPNLPAAQIAVAGSGTSAVEKQLAAFSQLKVAPYQDGSPCDLIIVATAPTPRKKPDPAKPPETGSEPPALSPELLQRVRQGTPLLVLPGDAAGGDLLAKQLAAANAFHYDGPVPTSRASWMGNWIFVRQHPLYDGMPVNEVMKGDYQIGVGSCYGLLVGGPGVEIVAAYSRDHDRNIGAVTFTSKLGRGRLVFQALTGAHPVLQQRALANALAYLLAK